MTKVPTDHCAEHKKRKKIMELPVDKLARRKQMTKRINEAYELAYILREHGTRSKFQAALADAEKLKRDNDDDVLTECLEALSVY